MEAAGEFEEGFEDLVGERGGNLGLVVAGLAQQGGQADALGDGNEAAVGEQEVERGSDGAAGDLGHEGDREGDGAGVFALGGVAEADGIAIAEDADGHAGLAEETLELLVGRGDPAVVAFRVGDLVERDAGIELADEEEPGLGGIGRV